MKYDDIHQKQMSLIGFGLANCFIWLIFNCVCVRVRVQRLDDVLEVCPTILTEDSMQAQHLGATLALYNLVKGQVGGTAVILKLCVQIFYYRSSV